MDNNKDVQLLKDKIWIRQVATETEVIVIRKSQVVEKNYIIRQNLKKLNKRTKSPERTRKR